MTGRRGRPVVLVVDPDAGDPRSRATPSRPLRMARALLGPVDVLLATPTDPWLDDSGVRIIRYGSPVALRVLMDNCDVAIVPAGLFDTSPIPLRTSARLVVDLSEPVSVTSDALRVGDFYLCATEPQRDYWLQVLVANGRVSRRTGDGDGRLRRLIDVVDARPSSLPGDSVPASDASQGERAWQRGVDPLRCYCGNASRTRDALPWVSPSLTFRALRVLRQEGARALATKSAAYLRRRLEGA